MWHPELPEMKAQVVVVALFDLPEYGTTTILKQQRLESQSVSSTEGCFGSGRQR